MCGYGLVQPPHPKDWPYVAGAGEAPEEWATKFCRALGCQTHTRASSYFRFGNTSLIKTKFVGIVKPGAIDVFNAEVSDVLVFVAPLRPRTRLQEWTSRGQAQAALGRS